MYLNEGDSYIHYCTIVSPLPTLFQILSMSFRCCCAWMLQVPERTVHNNVNPRHNNVNPRHLFSTKPEIQIALTLFYLGSNFGELYTYHLCKRYGNSARCLCINIRTPTLVVYSCSENKVGGWLQ